MVTQRMRWSAAVGVAVLIASFSAIAQPPGKGGKGNDEAFEKDQSTFSYLLDHRKDIQRKVTNIEKGVETLTESDTPEIAARITEHAEAMHQRLKDRKPIHLRDPLFAEVFRNAGKITMTIEKTKKGVKVKEVSDDPYVAKVIQAHAAVVSEFLAKGHDEVRKNHQPPKKEAPADK